MELFPAMPLAEWRDTKETLHRFCQVVGKLRLAAGAAAELGDGLGHVRWALWGRGRSWR